uniref:Uncharacterized protein n=1 Tax=Physcomitrium patens TaxID=3218 RepID=A0A2K1KGN3_PHYPA|nr:hypothetical protein PHYPA_009298 [Physcomitrium patens]
MVKNKVSLFAHVLILLTSMYSAEEEVCYLVILDARNIGSENPVVARLQLPAKYAFPYGFHGLWTDVDIKRT